MLLAVIKVAVIALIVDIFWEEDIKVLMGQVKELVAR